MEKVGFLQKTSFSLCHLAFLLPLLALFQSGHRVCSDRGMGVGCHALMWAEQVSQKLWMGGGWPGRQHPCCCPWNSRRQIYQCQILFVAPCPPWDPAQQFLRTREGTRALREGGWQGTTRTLQDSTGLPRAGPTLAVFWAQIPTLPLADPSGQREETAERWVVSFPVRALFTWCSALAPRTYIQ